jgi:RHS repeat-associated protein
MGNDLWIDPFAGVPGIASGTTGVGGGSFASGAFAGLSNVIVNPFQEGAGADSAPVSSASAPLSTGPANNGSAAGTGSNPGGYSGPTSSSGAGGIASPSGAPASSPLGPTTPAGGGVLSSGLPPIFVNPPVKPPKGGGEGGAGGGGPGAGPLTAGSGNGFFEYALPSSVEASNLVTGPDGNLWAATSSLFHVVSKITPSGTITAVSTSGLSGGNDIVRGPDGNLWFTAVLAAPVHGTGGIVAKITTSGTLTKYTLANTGNPAGITAGPDGNLWFTEPDNSTIAKITTSGTLTEYSIPTANSNPEDITLGVDGNLWFTESATNKIGKVTTSGTFTEYTVPTSSSTPWGIATGPDGNIWFTENTGNKIGRLTLGGTFTEYTIPTSSSSPLDIQPGPDGDLWFSENATNRISSITTQGSIAEYAPPSTGSGPGGVATGPDGSVWFTESAVGNVAKLTGVPATQGNPNYPNGGISLDPIGGIRVPLGEWTVATGNGDLNRQHLLDLNLNPADGSDATMGGSVALAYNSDSNSPQPIIGLNYSIDPNGTVPTSIAAQLTWNGTAQSVVTFTTTGHSAGDVYDLALQVNSAVTVTSAYPWSITVTAAYSGGNVVRSLSGYDLVTVNGSSSAEGPGWSLASVDSLVAVGSDIVWVYGSGDARFFKSLGGNAYLSPPDDFGTLVKNVGGSFTYTAKDQTQFNFNSSGLLTSVVNPEGLTRTYAYSSGVLSTITEPDGGVGTFNYTSGLLTSINEPGSRTVTLTYSSGYLNTIKDPDGALETFSYDASHRVNNDLHGPLDTTIGYDATAGLPNSFNQGLGVSETIAPQAAVGLATTPAKNASQGVGVLTDGLGHATTYALDAVVLTAKITTADGASKNVQYDFAGQPVVITDPRNNVTTLTYDYNTGKGDLTQITNSDGSTDQFQYDGTFHHMTVSVDGNGNRTTMAYDTTTGDLTTFTNALNQTTTYAYYQTAGKDNGLVQSTADPLGHITSFAYDANRRVTQVIAGYSTSLASTATIIYDTAGNLLSETDGISTTASYDHHTTTSFAYDAMRQPTQVVEAFGTTLQRTTTMTYDGVGDVLTATDPLGHITSVAYDQLGRPTTEVEAYGTSVAKTMTMIYDNASNLLSETDGISSTGSYDHHTTTSFGYDAVNRVNQVIAGYGTAVATTATVIFDLAGNLQSETDGISTTASYDHHTTTSFGYDVMNRENKVITAYGTSVAVTATMIYDQAGNLLSETDAISTTSAYDHHATTSYGYDALNRIKSVVEAYGTSIQRTTTIAYDAAGNTLSVTDPLNHITSYGYDALNRLTSEIDAYTTSIAVTSTFLYDAADNLQSQTTGISSTASYDHHATTSFGYDALNRVTTQILGYGTAVAETVTMLYDAADNLLSETTGISSTASYDHHATTSFGYDALNQQTQLVEAYGTTLQRTSTTVYDAAGNVLSNTDPLGNVTSYAYDALNRATTEIDGFGSAVASTATFLYDAADNLLSETSGQSTTASYDHHTTTSYGYDALNRVTTQILGYGSAVASTATMLYDAADNLLSETIGQSTTASYDHHTTTSFGYDALNRVTTQIEGYGTSVAVTATMLYDAADNLLSETTGISSTASYDHHATTSFGYDALNRQTQLVEAFGTTLQRTTTTVYDAADNVLSNTDPLGNVTSYGYDVLNRVTTEIDAYGNSVAVTATMLYDAADNLLSETTGQSSTVSYDHHATTSFGYDTLDRVTSVIQGYGTSIASTATMIYDQADNLLSVTTGISSTASYDHHATTSFAYDALNRRTTEIDAFGVTGVQRTLTTVYDAASNVQAAIDALGNATTITYDAMNRAISVQNPAGTATTVYDAASNVVNTIDANNNKATLAYDALNRMTTSTDPLGNVTTTVYDAASNAVSLTDPDNNTTTFVYDVLNRLTQQTDPLNHSSTYAYNAGDQLISTTDRLGRVRNLSYDALYRQTGETWVFSGTTVNTLTFTYDAAGNQLTAADANGAYTMAYDVLNRMTSVQEPYSQALTFTFDAASNRLTRTDSQGGIATETYDALNRLLTYQFSAGTVTLNLYQTWTARDQLATQSRYSDLSGTHLIGTTSYGYDNAGRLTNLQFKDGSGNNISNFTYSYDSGNRLTVETLNGSTTSYQYDADNQLTQSGTATFGYDANGNRSNTGYVTSTGNEMANDGTWTYTYDNEGNLTQKSKGTNLDTWTYAYDTWNRLVSATETNAGATVQVLTFKYDVFGNRLDVETTINAVTTATHFAYDGPNAWADLSGSNALQMRRLYLDAPDALFARISSGGTAAWYLTDRLGSVRDIANNTTGASIDHIDYSAFGVITNQTQSSNGDRYGFAGGELDSQTGEMRFGLRYYDPPTGRWITQDPIGFAGGDANLYRYVYDSPTNGTDPTGQDDKKPKYPQDSNGTIQVMFRDGRVKTYKLPITDQGVLDHIRREGKILGSNPLSLEPADLEGLEPPPGVRQRDLMKEMNKRFQEDFRRFVEKEGKEGDSGILKAGASVALPFAKPGPTLLVAAGVMTLALSSEQVRREMAYMSRSIGAEGSWAMQMAMGEALRKNVSVTVVLAEMLEAAKAGGNLMIIREVSEAIIANKKRISKAREAWQAIEKEEKDIIDGVLKGRLGRDAFDKLPDATKKAAIERFKEVAEEAAGREAEAARNLNKARVDFLEGKIKEPPGGIENFKPNPRE